MQIGQTERTSLNLRSVDVGAKVIEPQNIIDELVLWRSQPEFLAQLVSMLGLVVLVEIVRRNQVGNCSSDCRRTPRYPVVEVSV